MRFASVVEKAGKPGVHLILTDPEKDAVLQRAIKARRVMTARQATVGHSVDYGVVGFQKGVSGQVLVFPKSLQAFEGAKIVGVRYELLDDSPVPEAGRHHAARKAKPGRSPRKDRVEPEPPPAEKVVHFPRPDPHEEDETVSELKNGIRHAMRMLEQRRQVAAFNLLKRLIG